MSGFISGLLRPITDTVTRAASNAVPNLNIDALTGGFGGDLSSSIQNALGQGLANDAVAANDVPPDMRVRLRPLNPEEVYGPASENNILSILSQTHGMMFPYTPTINFSQSVNYSSIDLVHTNMGFETYQRTPSVELTVSGKFTVQNKREGLYSLAAIHFLRTASKMYFGEQDGSKAGLPPPILLFSGYGTYMFNDLRVILKSHSFTYEEGVDTVLVRTPGGSARLPVLFSLQINLTVQQTPKAMRKEFSLNKFRTGELMRKGGWI